MKLCCIYNKIIIRIQFMDLRELIKETLDEHLNKSLIIKEPVELSESLKYHVDNELTLANNIFNSYSEIYFDLINEVRSLWKQGKITLNEEDTSIVESDLGKKVSIKGELIYLDAPFIFENDINKFSVYVRLQNNQVKKILFENKIVSGCRGNKNRTTPKYWKCNLGRYIKQLGI